MNHLFRRLVLLTLLLGGTLIFAQEKLDEARETLRFVRLAETKKKLDLDEQKLLDLNALLDVFEEERFNIRKRERQLEKSLDKQDFSDAEANQTLDGLASLHRDMQDLEIKLITDVRQLLTPTEAAKFFHFYGKFQRDVQKRIRSIQEKRQEGFGPPGGGGGIGPRGPRHRLAPR